MWGTDALAYIHFIPTGLFALHLVVANKDVQQAFTEIIESLPCKNCTSHPQFLFRTHFFQSDAIPTLSSPRADNSPRHFDDPEMIIIHPQSQLYLDVHDKSCSASLPPFPDAIRFPTRTAFIDSMIETYLDPPTGQVHTKTKEMLSGRMSYFLLYSKESSTSTPKGDLEPVFGQKIRRTLSTSHTVELLVQTGSCM